MVDQITFQTIFQFLQTISIIVGISYYLMILRNQQKTQQTSIESRNGQFFMNLYNAIDEDIYKWSMRDTHGTKDWNTYEEWWEKYGPDKNLIEYTGWLKAQATYEVFGVMVKRGFVDIALVDDIMSGTVLMYWEASKPIIMGIRKTGYPQFQEHFEYLYEEIKKIVEIQHPDYTGIHS